MPVEISLQTLKQHLERLRVIPQAAQKIELWNQTQLHETVTPALTPSTWLRTGPDETVPLPAETTG